MKKKLVAAKKLSLHRETVTSLQHDPLKGALGGHYSIPAFFTCPECAPRD
ncbi:MAG TPA: class I lanthipeptide [Thermoanaerobaculia bacterium]|nr:class I lanthipeptide [Thermoanaerobaculia bacterium]